MSYDNRYSPVNLKDSNLFKPIKVGNMDLNQRIVMAPLTRMRATDKHVPNKEALAEEYYAQRSQAPGTFIITEASYISEQASGYPNIPGLFTAEQFEHWKPIFQKIHDNKSYVYTQLWNLGRQANPAVLKSKGLKFLSASDGVYMDEASEKTAIECGNELKGCTKEDIQNFIDQYVSAAKGAVASGADGVEIHSANGYLLNQFLDSETNKRTDEYGGSIENRSRFTLEVVDAVVAAIGADKVGIRFSPYGTFGGMSGGGNPLTVAQYSHVIGELEKRALENPKDRLAYIHIVEPRVQNLLNTEGTNEYLDGTNDFVFSIWKGVVIRAGNYALDNKTALKDVNTNDRTLIAYGRFFISNPDLVKRLEVGAPLNAYHRETFYTPGAEGYTDYSNYSS